MLHLAMVTVVVPDYDEALAYYVGVLGFTLVEDTPLTPSKRWVVVAPQAGGAALLLARAADGPQLERIGNQTGGRVSFFLATEDFENDFRRLTDAGVAFDEEPRREAYGRVAVFRDAFGNRWDLVDAARPQ
jgi:catechol 2,3-dioxygenase-like lactoylglutathione lyase family enzyme